MSIQIPGAVAPSRSSPTAESALTADPAAAQAFQEAMGASTETEPERVVTDEELQKAIGDSIMFKIINDTFDNLRKFKESLR